MNEVIERHRITGTAEYFRERSRAFALIAELAKQNEKTLFRCVQSARSDETVQEILRAQGRECLLHPCFDREEYVEVACGYIETRVYWTEEGVVREKEKSVGDEEGSSYSRRTYLNGVLHDIDGEPAVIVKDYHHIPEEKHLDENYKESWRLGEMIDRKDDYTALRARLSDTEARYYGWDLEEVAA